ncbi:MAG: thioredoxin-related protein [Sulfurimonas sp.]|jgi:thioredoxin-related protein|uniref:thioredoxin family protein n=1 Tax=Sulfurimonas sp. TaxID=2022749 RepID=UPI0039E5A5B2
MFKNIIISLVLVASSLFGAEISWEKDYESGVKRAMAENKPMFFIMSKTTCPPCIRLKNTTFKDERVVKMLDKHFVSVIAYVDKGDHVPRVLHAPYTPSLWFLKSNGEPRYEPLVGGVDAESFLKALDIVKKDFDKSQTK